MSSEPAPGIQCPHCQGRGVIELPYHLSETLDYLRKHGPRCAPQLKRALMPNATTASGMNNRLSALKELGLIQIAWVDGKTQYWTAKDS